MITKVQDNIEDWDHNHTSRPDSLRIFVSDDGYDTLCDELDNMNTRDVEGEHNPSAADIPSSIHGIQFRTDEALSGSDVRVAPLDVEELEPCYVEEPLMAHIKQVVFPERTGPLVQAAPYFKIEVPCSDCGDHEVEKRVPIVSDDEDTIYEAAIAQASETLSRDGLELRFKGVLIA